MKAMLSIKPEYVRRILSGEKTYEFRRRIFTRQDVDTIIIYTTSPVCRILAEAHITRILQDTPQRLWDRTHRHGGISHDKFMRYFQDRDTAYAIQLGELTRFATPRTLADYQVKTAPQSFIYTQ